MVAVVPLSAVGVAGAVVQSGEVAAAGAVQSGEVATDSLVDEVDAVTSQAAVVAPGHQASADEVIGDTSAGGGSTEALLVSASALHIGAIHTGTTTATTMTIILPQRSSSAMMMTSLDAQDASGHSIREPAPM